jgi:hypothetical protein
MSSRLALITFLDGAPHPEHPIYPADPPPWSPPGGGIPGGPGGQPPPGIWPGPRPPYVDIGGPAPQPPWGSRPSHPIYWPPYVDNTLPPYPAHPWVPPSGGGQPPQPPLGIWGGPWYPPTPTHPIVLPPNQPPTQPPSQGGLPGQLPASDPNGGWVFGYVPGYGWMWAYVPNPPAPPETGDRPHPDHELPGDQPVVDPRA